MYDKTQRDCFSVHGIQMTSEKQQVMSPAQKDLNSRGVQLCVFYGCESLSCVSVSLGLVSAPNKTVSDGALFLTRLCSPVLFLGRRQAGLGPEPHHQRNEQHQHVSGAQWSGVRWSVHPSSRHRSLPVSQIMHTLSSQTCTWCKNARAIRTIESACKMTANLFAAK